MQLPFTSEMMTTVHDTRILQMSNGSGYYLSRAQRWASGVPLAALIDGTAGQHAPRMKNAPGLKPRQRHHLHAMLGRMVM